ncbi:hypothetical protein BAUCODRAFT_140770 [Baudoinia panamericana UAMH 10762]|uniref:DUF1690 domain-containing protein n=1 Tax=Baudoinia panamericana (strain UAMH 10762) TaxID=717646 RepID=M2LJP6_BAUPA|nr:uncharacterized protein BAUCODRAFT_140770 [Baudoinia panamericana UAMH 10762]EMC94447.1 hypothetical protein BAUCODRAFT_140770 [Baudoinia panamericana UAMH 10762]
MGSGGSKPEQHIFNADAPVRFSQSVLDSLQRNPETDSTRAQNLELKVQARVNEELTRLRNAQAKQLSQLTDSLTVSPPPEKPARESSEPSRPVDSLVGHLSSPFYHDFTPAAPTPDAPQPESNNTSDSVKMEIAELKKKLEGRKKVEKVSREVEQAKDRVVRCLREKERRPLDCWQEVEEFKREVGRLEAAFVQRVGR